MVNDMLTEIPGRRKRQGERHSFLQTKENPHRKRPLAFVLHSFYCLHHRLSSKGAACILQPSGDKQDEENQHIKDSRAEGPKEPECPPVLQSHCSQPRAAQSHAL